MRKAYRFYKLAILALVVIGIQSCHKKNGIDNDSVIKKPYGLYIGDEQGALWNTNTGDSIKLIFPPDGYPDRSIITSGNNLLFVKSNTHLSLNDGGNFNPTDSSVTKRGMWQSIMLDVPDHGRVYLASEGYSNNHPTNGIVYSENNGKTWIIDTMVYNDTMQIRATTSLTQLQNGLLFAHSNVDGYLYARVSKNADWIRINPIGLPTSSSTYYYLSHMGNTLLLTDYSGSQGVWHSEDSGVIWKKYGGTLPNVPLYATYAPYDQDLFVGTKGYGVYRLVNGNFVPANNGLAHNTSVRAIAGKDDVYKNDVTKQYYYLATSDGLYRSEDNGQNWIQTIPGDFSTLY
ncbi:WD40/YVTN/BNR-like repeat-containing protein [Taibaiella soli]|uniref:Exo-alpha-sialidase n=1 Tax=Taibaiella soli TaxID=1649169 RepID=A0A2W2AC39_9BACT|nr:hypothetical protein [Taibaiella soli]PZF72985.1 hypothetical protein DN068_11280 [Taibaiella soli]